MPTKQKRFHSIPTTYNLWSLMGGTIISIFAWAMPYQWGKVDFITDEKYQRESTRKRKKNVFSICYFFRVRQWKAWSAAATRESIVAIARRATIRYRRTEILTEEKKLILFKCETLIFGSWWFLSSFFPSSHFSSLLSDPTQELLTSPSSWPPRHDDFKFQVCLISELSREGPV